MNRSRLTTKELDRLLWLAHRRSRAAGRGDAGHAAKLEFEIMDGLRPHLIAILRLADRAMYAKDKRR